MKQFGLCFSLVKQQAEMKRFATDRLLREIDKMKKGPDGLNGDYFLDAQDFDEQWAKKISVPNVKIEGAKATAHASRRPGRDAKKARRAIDE